MKLKILAAVLCAAALPVLAQAGTAPAEPRQAKLEVSEPAAAPKKASRSTKAHKSAKAAKKPAKKKAARKPQPAG